MRHCPFRPLDYEFPRGLHTTCGDPNCPGNARNHPIMPHFDSKSPQNNNQLPIMPGFDEGLSLMNSMDHIMDELLKPMYTNLNGNGGNKLSHPHHGNDHDRDLDHHRPTWTRLSPLALMDDRKDHVFVSDHKYQIKCRTEGYTPEELTVRTLNNFIMVEGRHEVNSPTSQSSRYFFKKWMAPDGVLVDRVVCHVNTKYGYIQIDAPRLGHEDRVAGKLIPIKVNSPYGSPNKISSPFGSPPRKEVHFDEEDLDKNRPKGPEMDKIIMAA